MEIWFLVFMVDRWMSELARQLVQNSVHEPPSTYFCFFSTSQWLVKRFMPNSPELPCHTFLTASHRSESFLQSRVLWDCSTASKCFPEETLYMVFGKLNMNLLKWVSPREVGFSGELFPCPWDDSMSCHYTSWLSAAWESSGSPGTGGLGHPLWLTITACGPFHDTGEGVAVSFIKFHFTWLEDRHWLSG